LEGLPELRSFARAGRAAEEQQAPAVLTAREEPAGVGGADTGGEVVHAGEAPARYPWDAGTPG
ncbi:MAG TPA: hypothetical protein VF621_07610, partial [Pyrinomonadaceae bacterium]